MLDLTAAEQIVDDCVSCGLCLESCPTYALWASEPDSPRGRIIQIGDALADGRFPEAAVSHIDNCLGDMACVSACPAGVTYDRLLSQVRPRIEEQHTRPRAEQALRRLLLETLPHPRRLQALLPLLRALEHVPDRAVPELLAPLVEAAPPTPAPAQEPLPSFTPARGKPRGSVGLLLGCVQRVFYPDVHRATIGVLTHAGYDVVAPTAAGCCGALELSAGSQGGGSAHARATVAALSGHDHILVNSAGCGAAMKDYGALLGTDQAWEFAGRVMDINEFLVQLDPLPTRGDLRLAVVYHDACQLSHAQGVRAEPRRLLAGIPGLELLEPASEEPDHCCGSAGIYNVLHPEPAGELGELRARALIDSGAQMIATANPGCAAQLARHSAALGTPLEVRHPVELLWRSIQAGRRSSA
ncbi:MAG: (Fe-S)-binding protein [Solirubrobacterales bacterium]|nr:(Fe-S)-binding protein [Solirubrobacterales bacterium]